MTSFTYRRSFRIQWADCDPAGIVFNPRFFEFFDTNAWLMFEAALGIEAQAINKTFGLLGIALVDVRANFMQPAAFGEEVELASRLAEFRRSSFDVEHLISIGGALAVEGGETRIWAIRRTDDPEKMSSAPIPASVIAKFGT